MTMKLQVLILLACAWALGAQAQATNSVPLTSNQPSVQRPALPAPRPLPKPTRPNQAVLGKTLVSGVAVQTAKTRNPLQLINPLAPAAYGSAGDNLAWNPATGAPAGIKIFAVQF